MDAAIRHAAWLEGEAGAGGSTWNAKMLHAAGELRRQAAEIERLHDELQLCCELKRAYQAQVSAEVDRTAEVRLVAVQVLRDMQAQGVLIEWQTVLAEALGERTE